MSNQRGQRTFGRCLPRFSHSETSIVRSRTAWESREITENAPKTNPPGRTFWESLSVCLVELRALQSVSVCVSNNQGGCQCVRKIDAQIDAENEPQSVPGGAPRHAKSSQNRYRDPFGTVRGIQERPEGISGASRGAPGAPGVPCQSLQNQLVLT